MQGIGCMVGIDSSLSEILISDFFKFFLTALLGTPLTVYNISNQKKEARPKKGRCNGTTMRGTAPGLT